MMRVVQCVMIAIGALWLLTGPARAGAAPQAGASQEVQASSASTVSLTRGDLESWLDGYMPFALKSNEMAGAIVTVVKEGKILLNKGYGYADVAARRPVDPGHTMFRAASITKTFTATAVMQLVEQGRLDLDRDVNNYLDFRLPPNDGKAVTLRHLLTHTAGFDDLQKGSSPIDLEWQQPLDRYLKQQLPNYVYPAGTVPAYSNYGIALAGYVVQRVSGEQFEDYLDRHLFGPLGMRHATCRQPIPAPLSKYKATAYVVASGEPQAYQLFNTRPAGCISISGAAMAPYMIMHLQDGRFGDVQILKRETAQQLHARTFSPVAPINGMALGFFQEDRNGRRIIGHDGDARGAHADMKLFLDDGVGFFVAFNSDGRDTAVYEVRQRFFEEFTDRYFPAPIPNERTASTASEHARMIAGSYQSSRRLNGVLSLFMMFNTIDVSANADGTISIPQPPTGALKTYHEIAPFLWREVNGKDLLAAKVEGGRVVSIHNHPVGVYIKMPVWKSANFNVPLLIAAVAVIAISLIVWLSAARIRKYHDRPPLLAGADARWHRLARVGAAFFILFIAGWILLAVNLLDHFDMFNAGLDPWLRALHVVGLIGVAGTVAVAVDAWRCWRGRRKRPSRIWSIVLLAACLWLTWFSFAFDLLTWRLTY